MNKSKRDPKGGISRRGFFQRSALAGAALSLLGAEADGEPTDLAEEAAMPPQRWGSPMRCAVSAKLLEADEETLW